MSWIAAAAIGAVVGIAGGVEANANRQREKGLIGTAYKTAAARMNLSQLDTREQVAESSGARGLDQGGDVVTGGPVGPGAEPSVGGAHTLGAQQTADLAREQTLEQTSLKNESTADLSNVNAAANQAEINAGLSGVETALNIGGLKGLPPAPAAAAAPVGTAMAGDQGTGAAASPYSSFGGIDPIHPLERGAWARPDTAVAGSSGAAGAAKSNADFNVNG